MTTTAKWYEEYKVSVPEGQSGEWSINRFEIPQGAGLYYAMHGRPVEPGTFTRLSHIRPENVWMSDTPAEISDHMLPIQLSKTAPEGAYVLINGLGIGMVLQAVLKNPKIGHVDVVEIEADVISLVGPHYTTDPRVQIHHADAYDIAWPKGYGWYMAWHDIWHDICLDNLEGIAKLHRKYGKRVGWQSSWMRKWLIAKRRSERSNGWW